MYNHITVGAHDFGRLRPFYDAVLRPLGISCYQESAEFLGYRRDSAGPSFLLAKPFDGHPAAPGNGTMIAFRAPDRAVVDAVYAQAMASGGTDEGPPGLRPRYSAGYYGAYFRDPEGNKLHVVHED